MFLNGHLCSDTNSKTGASLCKQLIINTKKIGMELAALKFAGALL